MKGNLIPICALLAAGLLLTGCAGNSEPLPSASPSMQPAASPSAMATSPAASPDTGTGTEGNAAPASTGGVTSVEDARRMSEQVEDELEKLSEVTGAQVVISGSVAGVALELDTQYQGGIDDRMKTMVKERIDSVLSGVSKIAITDDGDLYDQLETLGDRLEGASSMSEIQNELNAIVNKM